MFTSVSDLHYNPFHHLTTVSLPQNSTITAVVMLLHSKSCPMFLYLLTNQCVSISALNNRNTEENLEKYSVYFCELMLTNTYLQCSGTNIMEGTRGAGDSLLLFTMKTPCKQSQVSRPELIQDFYKSLDRKRGVVLRFFHVSSSTAQ